MLSHFDVPDILIRFLYCYVSMLNFIFYLKSEVTRGGIRGRGRPRGLRSPFSPYFKNVSLKLSNFALRFGHKCSKNAASNISTKLNFRWGWGGGGLCALPPQFFCPPLSGSTADELGEVETTFSFPAIFCYQVRIKENTY